MSINANKISSFANKTCELIKPQFGFSSSGQKKLEVLVRKSLFKEILLTNNKEEVDPIIAHFEKNVDKESVATEIAGILRSSNGVIQPSKSILSLIPFNNPNTLNIKHEGIEDLFITPIKELINQALEVPNPSVSCGQLENSVSTLQKNPENRSKR
jgi:hypothetical protein